MAVPTLDSDSDDAGTSRRSEEKPGLAGASALPGRHRSETTALGDCIHQGHVTYMYMYIIKAVVSTTYFSQTSQQAQVVMLSLP